jgi:hypothetical protein
MALGAGLASLLAVALGKSGARDRRREQQGDHCPFHSTHSTIQFGWRMRRWA